MNKLILKVLLLFLIFIFSLPLLWTFYVSLVENDLSIKTAIYDLSKYTLDNYKYILTNSNLLRWILNSIVITLALTVLNALFNTLAGFALAKYSVRENRTITFYVMLLIMVPAQAMMISVYMMIASFGMVDTYLGLIIPFMVNPFGVFMMRQFFLKFPNEILEATSLDGMSLYQRFRLIIFPIAKPYIITQSLIIFIWNWNSYMYPSIIIRSDELFTLPVGMTFLTNTKYIPNMTMAMAGVIITIIPVIVIYLVMQKYIVGSDIDSAIK